MSTVARLTWQVPEPSAFAVALARRLNGGLVTRPGGGLVQGAWTIDLGTASLEIRPWVREGPGDDPRPDGRLMLEPVTGGEGAPADRGSSGGEAHVRGPAALLLAGIGWATVELDRAEDELSMWLGDAWPPVRPSDPHLGARARVREAGGLPAERFVLLEPDTEGRLAASLARDGEGPCALYLRPRDGLEAWAEAARRRGVVLAGRRIGPLGPQRLVAGGPAAGPHLLLVDTPAPSKRRAARGRIAP
jgi:hypothetical protein